MAVATPSVRRTRRVADALIGPVVPELTCGYPCPEHHVNHASTPTLISFRTLFIQEGALRRACAALLQDPPVRPIDDMVWALRLLHRGPPIGERSNLGTLRRVAARAAPTTDVDQIRKALHSFPSASGAERSGLGPSHIRDAMRPASADMLLRLLSEVVNLLLQGLGY